MASVLQVVSNAISINLDSPIQECTFKHRSSRSSGGAKFLEQHFANQVLTDQKLCLYVCCLLEQHHLW